MLRLISIRDLRNTPGKLWRLLRRDKAVGLAVNGVPKAVVLEVEDGNVEQLVNLVRQVRAMDTLMRLRLQAAQHGGEELTEEEIGKEIRAARRDARRARSA